MQEGPQFACAVPTVLSQPHEHEAAGWDLDDLYQNNLMET